MMKKIKYIFIFLVIAFVLGGIIISKYVLPYSIIKPYKFSENITPSDIGIKSVDVNIIVEDSINLKGYWVKSASIKPKAVMLLIHGVGGCKEHFLHLAKRLTALGIESVLMDSRAHGESGGQYCTYGFKEKNDIAVVIDYIKAKNDSISIGIWGNSMGGAIAIQALELDKRIEFGIIESTFTNLNEIVYDYQKNYTYNIGLKPFCSIALNEAGKIAGFTPNKVSPLASVRNIEQPVLIAHGEADQNIKFDYGKQLFENLSSIDKKFIPVKGAGHLDMRKIGGDKYAKAIEKFIVEHLK